MFPPASRGWTPDKDPSNGTSGLWTPSRPSEWRLDEKPKPQHTFNAPYLHTSESVENSSNFYIPVNLSQMHSLWVCRASLSTSLGPEIIPLSPDIGPIQFSYEVCILQVGYVLLATDHGPPRGFLFLTWLPSSVASAQGATQWPLDFPAAMKGY